MSPSRSGGARRSPATKENRRQRGARACPCEEEALSTPPSPVTANGIIALPLRERPTARGRALCWPSSGSAASSSLRPGVAPFLLLVEEFRRSPAFIINGGVGGSASRLLVVVAVGFPTGVEKNGNFTVVLVLQPGRF